MKITKLNLGCGNRDRLEGYTNVDIVKGRNVDIICNVKKLSMIDSNSIEVIYASHVIEYFDPADVREVLIEWRRVLKVEGVLRLAVPDFESICTAYMVNMYSLTDKPGIHNQIYGKMSIGNGKFIYHKAMYDFGTLRKLLIDCGFGEVKRWDWREVLPRSYDDWSKSYLEHMNTEELLMSLNIEGVKK